MNQPNNKTSLVSIIMNCYNGEKYLKEAIDSGYAQTYDNWEIIFWVCQGKLMRFSWTIQPGQRLATGPERNLMCIEVTRYAKLKER